MIAMLLFCLYITGLPLIASSSIHCTTLLYFAFTFTSLINLANNYTDLKLNTKMISSKHTASQ